MPNRTDDLHAVHFQISRFLGLEAQNRVVNRSHRPHNYSFAKIPRILLVRPAGLAYIDHISHAAQQLTIWNAHIHRKLCRLAANCRGTATIKLDKFSFSLNRPENMNRRN